jgi:hypothetical protein
MVTYADLIAPAKTAPSRRVIDVAVDRMKDPMKPMPPLPAAPATPTEVKVLEDWIAAGMPSKCGAAGGDGGTTDGGVGPEGSSFNPYDTPVTCSSKSTWTGGDEGSGNMSPGGTCVSCHATDREAPKFIFGGTVYPTAHEPDDCNGVNGGVDGATVVIVDADGTTTTLPVNSVGNFWMRRTTFAMPYRAKVVKNGFERLMITQQTNGDCNACHTEKGTTVTPGTAVAPGRIMLP